MKAMKIKMKIRFYPIDFEYKLRGGKPFVHLYGKLENNTKICLIQEYQPYFYAKIYPQDEELVLTKLKNLTVEDKNKWAKVISFEKVDKELLGKVETFYKIFVNYPRAVSLISKELQNWGLECYEKDILFVHRYFRDNKITPMTLIEAEGDFINEKLFRVPVFLAESVVQESREEIKNLKILAVDIETYNPDKMIDTEKNPILMVAFYGYDEDGKEYKKVITWKKFDYDLDYLEVVDNEIELLSKFREVVLDYKPDIITGYFSDNFDFPYLKARADKFKVKLNLGLDYSIIDTGKTANMREGKTKINGILHLDVFKFVRNIFGKNLKTDSYSLNAVSDELLGHQKHDVDIAKLADTWDNHPDQLKEYCEYNLQDTYLTLKLCQKLIFDMIAFTKIVGLPLFDVTRMSFSKLVESYILKRAIDANVLAPNRPGRAEIDQRMEESYQGAFVFEPTPGIYENVLLFDFRSLYPTIISAHNIGPESLCCKCCSEFKVPEREQYWFCTKKKTFLPTVLERIILRRVSLKRLIKETKEKNEDENVAILEARSYALKTLANSFYGYMGFFGARWYCLECARSTTAYARNYIKDTIKKAESKGFQVIYGDTDSLFILLGEKNISQAMEFMNEINFDLPGHMELEYEGRYPRGIFVAAKGTDKGAKKKYALIDEDNNIKITGFETVRRNWSLLAKELQEKVLRLVLEDKVDEAVNYAKEVVQDLKDGKIELDKLFIKTQITKELSSYASIGPHVAVATKLLEKGINVTPGMVVEYIIAKGSGLVRDRAKLPEEVKPGDYDHDYYLNNQIIPALSSIFLVLGYNEDELFSDSSQSGLGDFF